MAIEILATREAHSGARQQTSGSLAAALGGPRPRRGPVWFRGAQLPSLQRHPRQQCRMKWQEGLGVTLDKDGQPANANGQTADRQGRLVACHHFRRCVAAKSRRQHHRIIADNYRGPHTQPPPTTVVVKIGRQALFSDPRLRPRDAARPNARARYRRATASPPTSAEQYGSVRNRQTPTASAFADESIPLNQRANRFRKLVKAYEMDVNGMLDPASEVASSRHARRRPPRHPDPA